MLVLRMLGVNVSGLPWSRARELVRDAVVARDIEVGIVAEAILLAVRGR